jgi:hypothetical protein
MINAALIFYKGPPYTILPMLTPAIPELFTVAAQDSGDLMLVGPATAVGSYWGGFVRAVIATND